ncbi:hypothetical protein KI387_039153, partial [Taxus chinensis]
MALGSFGTKSSDGPESVTVRGSDESGEARNREHQMLLEHAGTKVCEVRSSTDSDENGTI